MNILFLSIGRLENFSENGIYTDLLNEFNKRGHNIFVVSPRERRTGLPTVKDEIDGVTFLKVKIGNIKKVNIIEKGISTLLIEKQYLRAIKKYYKDVKFDLIMYSTPPITFYEVVKYIKNRDNASSYLLLKDIFPQNAVDLNMFKKNSFIFKYFKNKERELYQISDYIGTMSEANSKYILDHNPNIKENKVEVSPNTVSPKNIVINIRERNKIRDKYNIPKNKKVFIYGGNLGKPQGIDFFIECIQKNEKNHNSFFVIVGSGTEYYKLKTYFENNNITNSVLLNQLPKNEYELLANSSDVGMIFLDKRFTIPNFPSRLLSYMQAKMPVLSATDSNTDIGDIIEEGKFGYSCVSDNVEKFNELVNKLANDSDLEKMGQNAWDYLIENYTTEKSYEIIMSHFKDNL